MKQHVRIQAPLEGEAPPTLRTLKRLLHVGPMDSLVGFELEDLGKCFPAVLAAQGLLVLPLIGSLQSSPRRLELQSALWPGSESVSTL